MEIYVVSSWKDSLSGYRIFKKKELALCEWVRCHIIEKNEKKEIDNKLEIYVCDNNKDFHLINTYDSNLLNSYFIDKTENDVKLLFYDLDCNKLNKNIFDFLNNCLLISSIN